MDCFYAYPSILIVILWIKTNRIHVIKCMIASRFILYSGPINICNKFNVSMPQKKVTLHLNMITISGASNRWKDNCSKLLYFTYNYQVPSRAKVKGIVHIVRTWAANIQGATGNRTQKAVCFFCFVFIFNWSMHKHMLRARCNRNTSRMKWPLCNVLSKTIRIAKELVKLVLVSFWGHTYITQAVYISIEQCGCRIFAY